MTSKNKKKNFLKNLEKIVPKINLKKINVNPTRIIDETKNKLDGFYTNLKKEEKKKKRLEKKRKLDQKREIQREKN